MDILMYGIPNTWQKKIVELNFDTPNEFVELFELISYGEATGSDGLMTKPKTNAMEKQAKEMRLISRNLLRLLIQREQSIILCIRAMVMMQKNVKSS
jgi:hypothetical protein